MKAEFRDDLIASHRRRLGTDHTAAAAAVDDVLTRGAHSPHHRDVVEAFHDPDAAYARAAHNAIATLLDHLKALYSHFAPLMDWARTPAGIAALTHWAITNRPAPEQPCACLCPLVHPNRPTVCEGTAADTVTIPVCYSCALEHATR